MRDHLLWRGRSRFTGDPIAAVVTGLDRPSKNRKTGTMATVWVIPHAISPIAAIRSGTDSQGGGFGSPRPGRMSISTTSHVGLRNNLCQTPNAVPTFGILRTSGRLC